MIKLFKNNSIIIFILVLLFIILFIIILNLINRKNIFNTHKINTDKINTDKGVNLKLEHKLIPSELKDKFLEEFKEEGIHITGEQIDEFLKINNINK